MERNYRNSEFEQYLKESADQYRMFPSDKVWKGIHNTLHTRRKWYGAGLALLLLLTGTAVTWVMVSYPVPKDSKVAVVKNIPAKVSTVQPSTPASPEALKAVLPFDNRPAISGQSLAAPVNNTPVLTSPVTNEPVTGEPEQLVRNEREQTVPATIINLPVANKVVSPVPGTPETLVSATENNTVIYTTAPDKAVVRNEPVYPLTIESVTNVYRPKKASKRVSWQLYITPTVSYRKLSENKSQPEENPSSQTGFPFASLTDINKAVTHKPDMGFQLGVMARYPVSHNVKIRAGLQFNMNRYDIRAFAYNPEVATINLDGGNGTTNAVSTWTYYRNYNGYKTDWLKNFYFSVSAPIGVEVKLFGNDKTNFGIAGTIQPTYIIKDRAYLISTDYKNYATFPWLVRNVNLNTGFETFVNYSRGKTRWQVGPQVRYQILSSFHNRYPVKENLFDFGVKVGMSLNN